MMLDKGSYIYMMLIILLQPQAELYECCDVGDSGGKVRAEQPLSSDLDNGLLFPG